MEQPRPNQVTDEAIEAAANAMSPTGVSDYIRNNTFHGWAKAQARLMLPAAEPIIAARATSEARRLVESLLDGGGWQDCPWCGEAGGDCEDDCPSVQALAWLKAVRRADAAG